MGMGLKEVEWVHRKLESNAHTKVQECPQRMEVGWEKGHLQT